MFIDIYFNVYFRDNSSKPKDSSVKSGISPAFVFLQLYYGSGIKGASGEVPLLLSELSHARSVKNLDLVPPLETYRVGVLYVGPGQHDNETKILKNEFGSLRLDTSTISELCCLMHYK